MSLTRNENNCNGQNKDSLPFNRFISYSNSYFILSILKQICTVTEDRQTIKGQHSS